MNNFMNNGYTSMGRFPVAPYNQPVMSMYGQQQIMPQQMQQPVQQVMPQQVSMAELPITEIKFLNAKQIRIKELITEDKPIDKQKKQKEIDHE